jgi:hypothetical protein
MERTIGKRIIEFCAFAAALASATSLFAEKKFATYCDNMCGDTTMCVVTCCTITSETVGGIEIITNLNCSNSKCCAHPTQSSATGGSRVTVPLQSVAGAAGPVRFGLTSEVTLDASTIAVQSDDTALTITLSGSVKSAEQLRLAAAIAGKYAKGYQVINRLTISK